MIKNIIIGFALFILISATIPQDKIVGKWVFVEHQEEAIVQFIFNGDSTFEYLAIFKEPFVTDTIQFEGKYSILDSLLTISPANIESEEYKIIRIQKDSLHLQYKTQRYLLSKEN